MLSFVTEEKKKKTDGGVSSDCFHWKGRYETEEESSGKTSGCERKELKIKYE